MTPMSKPDMEALADKADTILATRKSQPSVQSLLDFVAEFAATYRRTASDAVPAWRDIASAPKDGTPFLAFTQDDEFRPITGIDLIWFEPTFDAFTGDGETPLTIREPTLWRPLPDAPGTLASPPSTNAGWDEAAETREALEKMVHLYESERDCDGPFKRPEWLVRALSRPASEGQRDTKSDGPASSNEKVGGLPVPAAPTMRSEPDAMLPTRQGAVVERRDGSGVTAGETAPHPGDRDTKGSKFCSQCHGDGSVSVTCPTCSATPAREPDAAVSEEEERERATLQDLHEIADGALGHGLLTRGLARDEIARRALIQKGRS